jgi:hypothetical protein
MKYSDEKHYKLSSYDWRTIEIIRGKLLILADYMKNWDGINYSDPVTHGILAGIMECANQLIDIKPEPSEPPERAENTDPPPVGGKYDFLPKIM